MVSVEHNSEGSYILSFDGDVRVGINCTLEVRPRLDVILVTSSGALKALLDGSPHGHSRYPVALLATSPVIDIATKSGWLGDHHPKVTTVRYKENVQFNFGEVRVMCTAFPSGYEVGGSVWCIELISEYPVQRYLCLADVSMWARRHCRSIRGTLEDLSSTGNPQGRVHAMVSVSASDAVTMDFKERVVALGRAVCDRVFTVSGTQKVSIIVALPSSCSPMQSIDILWHIYSQMDAVINGVWRKAHIVFLCPEAEGLLHVAATAVGSVDIPYATDAMTEGADPIPFLRPAILDYSLSIADSNSSPAYHEAFRKAGPKVMVHVIVGEALADEAQKRLEHDKRSVTRLPWEGNFGLQPAQLAVIAAKIKPTHHVALNAATLGTKTDLAVLSSAPPSVHYVAGTIETSLSHAVRPIPTIGYVVSPVEANVHRHDGIVRVVGTPTVQYSRDRPGLVGGIDVVLKRLRSAGLDCECDPADKETVHVVGLDDGGGQTTVRICGMGEKRRVMLQVRSLSDSQLLMDILTE